MATKSLQSSPQAGEFSIDLREHGFPEGPAQVVVEISPAGRGVLMAILAAGADGRYSFDFTVGQDGIEITKAYIEGMRAQKEELPEWVAVIREEIERQLGL